MRIKRYLCSMLGASVMTLSGSILPHVSAQTQTPIASLGEGFSSGEAIVNGTSIHYVRGGSGPAVVLVHGFPEDWYEFHHIMPLLAKKFTVVAVDLRGVGGSAPIVAGYDAANLAEDLRQLAEQLQLKNVYIVGHDIGGMVAYAFLRKYPQTLRGAMILDVAIPGLEPWDKIKNEAHSISSDRLTGETGRRETGGLFPIFPREGILQRRRRGSLRGCIPRSRSSEDSIRIL
jgi:pimeloyl-ACP methyl ester carboxylesterase